MNIDNRVTFVIPSINRPTLRFTLMSLVQQTDPHWTAIVAFDSVKNINFDDLVFDKRIMYVNIRVKLGSKQANHNAGLVRNAAFDYVSDTCAWVAFVDDDDMLEPSYVQTVRTITEKPDCVIFRMRYPNGCILPALKEDYYRKGTVGIAFAIQRHILTQGYRFVNSDHEDYEFLEQLRRDDKKVVLTSFVLYNVRSCCET